MGRIQVQKGLARTTDGRGFVLVVTLLLMLALLSIGLIAIRSTANNMAASGAQRVTNIAQTVTSSGVEGTMVLGAMNPGGFIEYVEANGGTLNMTDFLAGFYDTSVDGSGSFGREVSNVNTAGWQSRMIQAQFSSRAPGYQVGEHCFIKYTAITNGTYRNMPNLMDANDVQRNIERNALARDLTTLYVGPINCP